MAGYLFGTLFVMMAFGIPIAVSLGAAVVVALLATGANLSLMIVPQRMFTSLDSFPFTAIPFFILAGNIMCKGGISRRLITVVQALVGRTPASLANVTTVASAFFGAISGSNPATVAAIGGIMAPDMIEKGYSREDAGAIAAASGTLGVVIPPSIPMVTYAITASVSVTTMFIAGFVPGVLLAAVLIAVNILFYGKTQVKPPGRFSWGELLAAGREGVWALLMPILILGGIYGGLFTPTEAAAIACAYAFVVSRYFYRELSLKDIVPIFTDSATSSAVILFTVCLAAPFSWIMASKAIPAAISTAVLSVIANKYLLLLTFNVILLFLGLILDTTSIILLMVPILLPMANSIGLDLIALGIIIIVNTSIGMITPPMAANLFVATRISGASMEKIAVRIVPFLIAETIVLLLLTYVPGIVMFLPRIIRS